MTAAGTFFDAHQRRTAEAAMARIIPTDDTPGAREAGCVDFLDGYLSGTGRILAKPDGSGFVTLGERSEWAWRQRLETLRATYVEGLADLDRRARDAHGAGFADLPEDAQDALLSELERPAERKEGSAEETTAGYGSPPPALQQTSTETELPFFALLCTHTRQGFYCDPVYGGNRNRVGWKVVGFPGPSLAEVHDGASSSTLPWFAEDPRHPSRRAPA
jgi:gluconate 2-dehydrogenase gamma chain